MTDERDTLILNVDDTAVSRLATTLILRQAGFTVVEASSGRQALDLAQQLPHLILLDVNLPDISGFEVCRTLKSDPHTAAIPVVHLSASYITTADRVTGLEEGADGYLTQPVQPTELVATIKAFVRLKRAERALRVSETRYRALFECSHDALMTLSPPAWRFASSNPAAMTMFGIQGKDDLCSCCFGDLSPIRQSDGRASVEKAHSMFELALRNGSHFFEWVHIRASGAEFPATVLLTRIEGDGQLLLLATVRDESEKRRLEANVAQADRLASMGILAAGMAHELNNPLAYVHYNIESLAQDMPPLVAAALRCCAALRARVGDAEFSDIAGEGMALLQPELLEDAIDRVQEALDGTRRMKAMTRGLGMFSRVEQVERTRFDLARAVDSAINLASSEISQRAIVVRDYGELPSVWGSEGKLSLVLLNLLVNAAQAIEDGNAQNNRITVSARAENDAAYVEIADTGKGIPADQLDQIFEPFFTTKPAGAGAGLGLAICKSIVSDFRGELRVESELGKGTRFTLRLPIDLSEPQAASARLSSDIPRALSPLRGRILVVDDEPALRKTMERMLGGSHDLVLVTSGEEAQALLEEDPAFDAIVCDLMMSEMSGMALHAWLTERDPWLARQVVFVTGGAFTPRASAYLSRIENTVLEKPIDSDMLKRVLSKLVGDAQRQR